MLPKYQPKWEFTPASKSQVGVWIAMIPSKLHVSEITLLWESKFLGSVPRSLVIHRLSSHLTVWEHPVLWQQGVRRICLKVLCVGARNLNLSVLCAAHSLDESMPLASGEAEDDPDKMHVDRDLVTGGGGQFPVSRSHGPTVEDTKLPEGGSVGPKEIEIYTVSAMQTPCRCKNQYACYF